jgi:hypothetical protein
MEAVTSGDSRRSLPFRKGHKTNLGVIVHGSHALVRAYFSGALKRSTREGRIATALENAYALHKGYHRTNQKGSKQGDFAACPQPLQDTIMLIVGLKIFIATYEFNPESKTGARDLHTAINALARLVASLGLTPVEKQSDLAAAFVGMEN